MVAALTNAILAGSGLGSGLATYTFDACLGQLAGRPQQHGPLRADRTGLCVQIAPAVFDGVSDFTVDGSTATSANGLWQYGSLPDLSDSAASFGLYNITTLTWQGAAGLTGYLSSGAAEIPLLLCNQSLPPATIVAGTASVPVGFLEMHPGASGQYSTLRFVAPLADNYALSATFVKRRVKLMSNAV